MWPLLLTGGTCLILGTVFGYRLHRAGVRLAAVLDDINDVWDDDAEVVR